MLRGRDIKKRRRATRFTLESLEDRVALSAAGGAAQVVAEVDVLNSQLQTKFARLDAHVIGRIAQLDQGAETALEQASETDDGEATGYNDRAPTVGQIVRDYNTFVRHIGHRVNVSTRQSNSGIDRAIAQSSRVDSATVAAIAPESAQVRNVVAAISDNFKGEAEAARDVADSLASLAHAAVYHAATYGLSATSEVDAVDRELAQLSRSQQAGDQAAYEALMGTYNNAFSALQSQLAPPPSGPSTSIAGAGTTGTGAIGSGLL